VDLRWEWLAPLVTVPYVPALGPVHPSALTAQRFADVLAVAGTGGFVPYDKDRRWAAAKSETVLAEDISCQRGLTLIPTLGRHRAGTVRVHVYTAGPGARARAAEQAGMLRVRHGAAAAQLVSFHDPEHPPPGPAMRVQLKDFEGSCPEPELPVGLLTGLPAAQQATFAGFAAGDGRRRLRLPSSAPPVRPGRPRHGDRDRRAASAEQSARWKPALTLPGTRS